MAKVTVFNFVTLNGYFKGTNEDIGWHKHGGEEAEYSAESLSSGNTLLFGRVTYEMMVSFWPTRVAAESFPDVAKGMNEAEKIVFSRTLKKADWNNTRVINENIVDEIRKLKQISGNDMTLLGSGSILTQFADEGLIDEYRIMIDPVAIGDGAPIFKSIKLNLDLKLIDSKTFKSGVVLLSYEPR
jgi:dihydrofolate reductase